MGEPFSSHPDASGSGIHAQTGANASAADRAGPNYKSGSGANKQPTVTIDSEKSKVS